MTEYLFQLSETSTGTLQSRIQEMMVSAIVNRHVRPGMPLPSGRKLADQLKVSRNTVVLAYQNLVDEGFIETRQRSGYYVCEDVLSGYANTKPQDTETKGKSSLDWKQLFSIQPSKFVTARKQQDWQNFPYAFLYGQYDKEIFPISDWRECCRDAASISAIYDWASDHIDQDNSELIDQIHNKLLPRRGIFVEPDEILVTLGAQNAIFLTAQLLLSKDKTIGIENPGYVDARNTFLTQTDKITCLDVDEDGLVIDEKLDDCDCVYVTPSHQYPTTVTMPIKRRTELLKNAKENNFIIIEDDYEAELTYNKKPLAALKSQDTDGRVIYIGSISKTLAPGIRLGFMVAPKEFIEEARVLRRLMLKHPPSNNQFIIARFLQRGYHDSLIRKLSLTLYKRSNAMRAQIDENFPGEALESQHGGSALWIKGPKGLDSRKLAEELLIEGVLIEPGDVYFYPKKDKCEYFRLGFSSLPEDKIATGIEKIIEKIKHLS
ncbi:PLP-dependent aminotransferase family protein [uncultured Cocleimonas sp.]|uniref:MocR-like pyridoxine biosynthesis transcription factor PdxR n=1 Tax=uncultured Cocleimonas sp. TaxID=1051587 RepID=UPI0026343698|nr:PLP-dependent aminotransferase family protein [uncultured Cocleimonas sp.]